MKNIFLQNKYTRTYFAIVSNALARNLPTKKQANAMLGYAEHHHIIPTCLGGPNTKENKIYLTGHEHFVCHRLLTKMTTDPQALLKLHNAIWMMQATSRNQSRYKINGRTYAVLKRNIAEAYRNNPNHRSPESRAKQSATMKGRSWEETYGKEKADALKLDRQHPRGPRSDETKAKLRAANLGKKRSTPSKLQGRVTSDEVKQKISDALKGRPGFAHTDESKANISKAKQGTVRTEESKLKQSASTKGKSKSPEHRAKIAEAAVARWAKKRLLP